jgi:hypothetical protein
MVACAVDEVDWTDVNGLIVTANPVDAPDAGMGAAVEVVQVEQVEAGPAGSRRCDLAATCWINVAKGVDGGGHV